MKYGETAEEVGEKISIYIHMPFCRVKCPYCDFNSISSGNFPEERYVESLVKELSDTVSREGLGDRPLESIYIGGGTPSLFSPSSIRNLLESVRAFFPSQAGGEVETTIEANPDSLDRDKLEGYKASGINRLSIGVQSLDDNDLKTLGRLHSAGKAAEVLGSARSAGFDNMGIDLIYGIPGQTVEGWMRVLEGAVSSRPEHLSLYNLTIEENTPFHGIYGASYGDTPPPEEDQARMYEAACWVLEGEGYLHYEISNFSRPGFPSRHNMGYWCGRDYIGLGAGAHSYLSHPGWGRRLWNEKDPFIYMERAFSGRAKAGEEFLSKEQAVSESLVLGLRLLEKGVDGELFRQRFGFLPGELLRGRLEECVTKGLIRLEGEDLLLTPEGTLLSDSVFVDILSSLALDA